MELGSMAQGQSGMAMMAQTMQNQQTMGMDVVTKTINSVNQQGNNGGGNADQEFQTKVMMAEATGKGVSLDASV
jgi:hypothetical protein